jgi:hypothetical protein
VSNETSVTNTNYVTVNNTSYQIGTTGDTSVSGNTHAGNATSGNVTNTNYTSVGVSVSN